MTGKLMKYELRSMLRTFLPLWGVLLVVAFLNRFTLQAGSFARALHGVPATLLMVIYVIGIMAIAVVAFVFMIQRFYNGLLKDEGYLMFTLPVKTSQLIWAKCLSAAILVFATSLVCVLSVFLMVLNSDVIRELSREFTEIARNLPEYREITSLGAQCVLLGLVSSFVSAIAFIMQAYLAMALGQLANKHRAAWSVLAFVGISVVLSTLGITSLSNNFFGALSSPALESMTYSRLLWAVFGSIIVTQLVETAIFYFPAEWILRKRLNLE